jgi:hypothetical protein
MDTLCCEECQEDERVFNDLCACGHGRDEHTVTGTGESGFCCVCAVCDLFEE